MSKIKPAVDCYTCPQCGSDQVTTESHQMFMVNSGEHYCHSMKTGDSDSPADCLRCGWEGQRHQLVNLKEPSHDR